MATNSDSSELTRLESDPISNLVSDPGPQTTTTTTTTHHLATPPAAGLTQLEFTKLVPSIIEFHSYQVKPGSQCSTLHALKIHAPRAVVWSILRRFDKPQVYKHFIKSCNVEDGFVQRVGSTRYVTVISGLPATTSTERLDVLDEERRVMGFTIVGGEHRLRNYRSVMSLHALEGAREGDDGEWTVVLESYAVDVPDGNTVEDTRLFADTVVKLNLQKLAAVSVGLARGSSSGASASGSGGGGTE